MVLYPLKFIPILKERLWGGTKLKEVLHKPISGKCIGESWELSGLAGAVSEVANGALAGTSLQTLINQAGPALMGQRVVERFGLHFPILIKFIAAQQDLSVQLHPDDALAQQRHHSPGKTEMWYLLQADPGAQLIAGFAKEVSQAAYIKSLKEGKLLDLLHYEPARAGDAFFIPPGTIHAIGAGTLLAEIQQASDITYRVFDFDRKDKNGQPRALHTDLALEALDYKRRNYKISYARAKDTVNRMVACPYFTTHFLELTRNLERNIENREAFTVYICVEGQAEISNDWGSALVEKGETVLIAADSRVIKIATQGATLLEITV